MQKQSHHIRHFLSVLALAGLFLVVSKNASHAYSLTSSWSFDGSVYTYDYVGSIDTFEYVDHLDLWLDLTWNADNDGTLDIGENYEITGTPASWSSFGEHLVAPVQPLAGDLTTYSDHVAWTYDGGFPGLLGPSEVNGFQIQSTFGPDSLAFSWANGQGISGTTSGPSGGSLTLGSSTAPVPEPGTLFLVGGGLLLGFGLKKRKKS